MNKSVSTDSLVHTKEYENEILNYKLNLEQKGLPVIYSLKHFSLLIDVPYQELMNIITYRSYMYSRFRLEKKNGGYREIVSPKEKLKYIQRTIYENILLKVPLEAGCIGFRRELSIKDNAGIHSSKKLILNIDLYRFFDTITEKRVFGIFKELGYHNNLSVDFAKLTTVIPSQEYFREIKNDKLKPKNYDIKKCARLAQGAPTSPMISNIICRKLDRRLNILATKNGFSYSRYADDLTFSTNENTILNINIIKRIVEEEGFFVNNKKINISRKGTRQLVTGLTVTNGVHVPKQYKQDIKKHIYYCKKFGVISHLKKIDMIRKSNFKEWLLGQIFYVKSIEPQVGLELLEEFNEIDWII